MTAALLGRPHIYSTHNKNHKGYTTTENHTVNISNNSSRTRAYNPTSNESPCLVSDKQKTPTKVQLCDMLRVGVTPQDAPMLTELARALRGLGKHAEAQRCCAAAVSARPDYATGWLELGRAQAAQGNILPFHKFQEATIRK